MNADVKQKFESYPSDISDWLLKVRGLILSVAENDGIDDLTETLKWNEPTYISKIGSAIRFDWKAKAPDQICIYFNCKTKLIETFKEIYGDTFTFEGKRGIVFTREEKLPLKELSHCISMALRYKKLKHLDLLGA